MARPLRLEYPGAVYHLTSRGNGRADIFLDDADREMFLRAVAAAVARYRWRMYAYCLMSNHYHLLVETPEANLSRGMRQLNGTYTQRFNRRHGRVGHVLQGRFKAIVVDRERYLLELSRYIALNPVRAGISGQAEAWRWSSYRATAGLQAAPPWRAVTPLLERFSADACAAAGAYRRFVAEGAGAVSPWAQLRGQVLLGTQAFVEEMAPRLGLLERAKEVPRVQRFAARPALSALLARHLGVHSTVSRIAGTAMRQFKT